MKKIIVLLMILNATVVFSSSNHEHAQEHDHKDHDEHGHEHESNKAIVEVDETKGFKLSQKAFETLKIKTQKVENKMSTLPFAALVSAKEKRNVYIVRNDFFKLTPVKVISKTPDTYKIEISDFEKGDLVVIGGTALLNIADVYSKDKSDYGHSH